MVTFDSLLSMLYEIQGASDPNAQGTPEERLAEIREIADRAMRESGYMPDTEGGDADGDDDGD